MFARLGLRHAAAAFGSAGALAIAAQPRGGVACKAEGFPEWQRFVPPAPYGSWFRDWDGRQPEEGAKVKLGPARHIILVRHGQYDETHKADETRKLTPLGRAQAEATGARLAALAKAYGVKAVRVSSMTRAIETAEIIAGHLPLEVCAQDPMLDEGYPAQATPRSKPFRKDKVFRDGARIEAAFRKYFYRSKPTKVKEEEAVEVAAKDGVVAGAAEVAAAKNGDVAGAAEAGKKCDEDEPAHEFEVIVCHGNVIRAFVCRALQLPPEAWLRMCPFNCSLTYLRVSPRGTVSLRSFGDVGHLALEDTTFSMHEGLAW